ncbi:BatA domain-containing protein [Tundrisphaera sp. TA3]|uniref:BatA domain-containing protein n=1 Tax=Tundrisphaera sp. TA3 TaxID=3435775 RepID=UPI003EB7F247
MDISLLHAGLAAGAGLAAVPVILHLMMKQKPKRVIFPALRLIQERHKRSKKKLRIKNWLLLLARMMLLALMALALARPTLHSEVPLGDQEVPTALALVFDTSQSMEYTERGKNRLAEAKALAGEILKKSTDDSEVYVIDSAEPFKPAPLSPGAARKRVDALALRPANRVLNEAVIQANAAVAASNLSRREVYVLTDLARSAWDLSSTRTAEELARPRKSKILVSTYVLQLSPKDVRDVAVVSAEPAPGGAAEGEPIEIRAKVRSSGPKTSRVVELWLDGAKRDQKNVEIPANGEVEAMFLTPPKLAPGLHQGSIKIGVGGTDNLPFDDVRYFSFALRPALDLLVVSDYARDPARPDDDAVFVQRALSPEGADSAFRAVRETTRQFQARTRLTTRDFAGIFLLNVETLQPADWSRLAAYVREGGGLVVAPGNRSRPDSYNNAVAAGLLPATLDAPKVPAEKTTTFAKADLEHPLFNRYAKLIDSELGLTPVYRYWKLKQVSESARVLLRYAGGDPALLERTFKGTKTGHVLLWTTPLSRRVDRADPAAWNEFPIPASWGFVGVMLETAPYLAGTVGETLNYEAGQDVVLPIDPGRRSTNYTVQGPDPKVTDRLAPPATSDDLLIPSPASLGQWAVEGKAPDGTPVRMGFSVNAPQAESQVVALKPGELDAAFGGKEFYKVADNAQGLRDAQASGRVGTEIFPILMFLILLLVTAENVLANKFHREAVAA